MSQIYELTYDNYEDIADSSAELTPMLLSLLETGAELTAVPFIQIDVEEGWMKHMFVTQQALDQAAFDLRELMHDPDSWERTTPK